MAHSRKDGFSYLDGVQVKISEKFRPPRRIVLPVSLSRNTYPETLQEHYDFGVELRAIEFAERYRQEQEAKRQARVDRVADDIQQFTKVGTSSSDNAAVAATASTVNDVSGVPAVVPSGAILLPAPAAESRELPAGSAQSTDKAFSLAEFENDSSSPFDYVELQTINDLEELNSVFQGISGCHAPIPNGDDSGIASQPGAPTLEESGGRKVPFSDAGATTVEAMLEEPKPLRSSRSASDIRSSGDKGLWGAARRSNTPPAPCLHENTPLSQVPTEAPEKPKRVLNPEVEKLLVYLVDMGFEEERALWAIECHGTDDKKVIEHLCQMQSLVECGFTNQDAHEALRLNKGSYEQALEFLKLEKQFLGLGFQKEAVKSALIESQNDRDKALDTLLA